MVDETEDSAILRPIEQLLKQDKQLLHFYENDAFFQRIIDESIRYDWTYEMTLIALIKQGYMMKEAVEKNLQKYMQNNMRPLLLVVDKDGK